MVVESDGLLDDSSRSAATLPQDAIRIRLDMPRTDDLADIMFLANNHRIAANLIKMPYPFSLERAKALIAKAEKSNGNNVSFAIRLRSTGRFIGMAQYSELENGGPVNVGYWLGEPFWGHGYATEAVQTLIDHAFTQGTLDELTAACRVTNPASRRVLVKSGFQYRDQSIIHSLGAGGSVPIERYSLDRTVWMSLKRWGRQA